MSLAAATPEALVPGDPGSLRSLACRLRRIAAGLAECQAVVSRLHAGGWTGPAAQTLAERLTHLQRPYAEGASALGVAAQVAARHAEVMSHARTTIGRAIDDARDAERRSAVWRAACAEHLRLAGLVRAVGAEYRRPLASTPAPPGEDPGAAALAAALRAAQQAVEEVRRSGQEGTQALRAAASRAPREPDCVDVLGSSPADAPAPAAPATGQATASSAGHTILDLLGLVPVIGDLADVPNAIWYARDHDWLSAGLTAAGLVPLVGDLAEGGRLVARVGRTAEHEAVGTAALAARKGVPLGFGDAGEFTAFADDLGHGLREAGYADVVPVLQGSAVTGRRFLDGRAFDESRLSDLDIALGSPRLMERARDLGIALRSGGTRTGPLTDGDLARLDLRALAHRLSTQTGRPVSFMLYDSADAALARRPGIRVG